MSEGPAPSPLAAEGFEPMNAPWLFDDEHVQRGRFAPPEKKPRKSKVWPILSGLVIAATVAACVYIGVRLDNQNVEPPLASQAEVARQELAVSAARIAAEAHALEGEGAAYADAATHAEAWERALGGVWIPWPTGAPPSGHTNPPLETAAPTPLAPVDMLADITAFASRALDESAAHPAGSEREFFMRLAVDARVGAHRVAQAAGLDAPAVGAIDMAAAAEAVKDSTRLNRLDTARQWLEREAASVATGERTTLESRIESLTALEDAMLAAGCPDERPAVATYPTLDSGESLSELALGDVANTLLEASSEASIDQNRAILAFILSLYHSDAERAGAEIIPLG